jgi:hypothetical protein
MLNFEAPVEGYGLTFEDDGKVAYAYLKKDTEIVGDVWLYNRCEAPDSSEWRDKGNIPFANCANYIGSEGRMLEPITSQDVAVIWETEDGQPVSYIYILRDLFGVVGPGDKPGYARHAIKSGPLAKVMEIE